MTVDEAVAFVRVLLDEPKYEYFGLSTNLDGEFREALRQAAAQVAREMHLRGEKEGTRPLYVTETISIINTNQVVPTQVILEVCEVWSNWYVDLGSVPMADHVFMKHAYVPPQEFHRRLFRAITGFTPSVGLAASEATQARLEYTMEGGDIYVNRENTVGYQNNDVSISYLAVPTIPVSGSADMPLAEYTHGIICDVAAGIMYRKEHPGDMRPSLGGLVDLEAAVLRITSGGQV